MNSFLNKNLNLIITIVGIINLIPFPAFDGGRVVFLIIEKIKGSRVNPKLETYVNFIGFIILMGLMILITIKKASFPKE